VEVVSVWCKKIIGNTEQKGEEVGEGVRAIKGERWRQGGRERG